MNIEEIKEKLGVQTLSMTVATKKDGSHYEGKNGEKWVRNFNNDKRIAVAMPQELFDKVKADPAGVTTLYLEAGEERKGEKGVYTSHRILSQNPENIYGTL